MRIEFYLPQSSADGEYTWDLQENGVSLLGLHLPPEDRKAGYYINSEFVNHAPSVKLPLSRKDARRWLMKSGLAPKLWCGPFWEGSSSKLDKFVRSSPDKFSTRLVSIFSAKSAIPDFIQSYLQKQRVDKEPTPVYSIGAIEEETDTTELIRISYEDSKPVVTIVKTPNA